MNEKQEEFILYCLSVALTRNNSRKTQQMVLNVITKKFNELEDTE